MPLRKDGVDVADAEGSSNSASNIKRLRSSIFSPSHRPFQHNQRLQLIDDKVKGAFWFMNPTRARFALRDRAEGKANAQGSKEQRGPKDKPGTQDGGIEYEWTSRNNRKGRHALIVHRGSEHYSQLQSAIGLKAVLKGIWRMSTYYAFWDPSYLTAIAFTTAIVILLINAIISALPYARPSYSNPKGTIYVEGALSLAGCSMFLVSSLLNFIEAVNADTKGCFGWKREQGPSSDGSRTSTITEDGSTTRIVPDWNCIHRRQNYYKLFGSSANTSDQAKADDSSTTDQSGEDQDCSDDGDDWRWFPSSKELTAYFIYDLGFVTCSILVLSSLMFCSAAIASFATILVTGEISYWIRIPQVIAGVGFMTSSLLFLLETQSAWLKPELRAIGWHVSLWNLIGSIGFTMFAAFGLTRTGPRTKWAEDELAYSYLWGCCAFLVGSLLQWYEAVNKHVVRVEEGDDGHD